MVNGHQEKKLRRLLKKRGIIRSLGCHDVFSALIAQQAGFETLFIGGFGTSASLLGVPDVNLLTLTEMAGAVRRMAARLSLPLVADGDTGHGGIHNIRRTVMEFEEAGASGMILEDQVSPKRCGHFEGKGVVSASEMVIRIRAALSARKSENFILIARTDARAVSGLGEAIKRVRLYAQVGADVVFIEAPRSRKELETIPKAVNGPLLVNMLTGGKTPNVPVPELEKMGYKIVVYPIESLLIFATAMKKLAESVLKRGDLEDLKSDMIGFSEVKKLLALDEMLNRTKV